MCDVESYLSECCGAPYDKMFTYESGEGVCSKCKEHAEFWDKYENKEYEDGEYYELTKEQF
jgi:hypothetical protein